MIKILHNKIFTYNFPIFNNKSGTIEWNDWRWFNPEKDFDSCVANYRSHLIKTESLLSHYCDLQSLNNTFYLHYLKFTLRVNKVKYLYHVYHKFKAIC